MGIERGNNESLGRSEAPASWSDQTVPSVRSGSKSEGTGLGQWTEPRRIAQRPDVKVRKSSKRAAHIMSQCIEFSRRGGSNESMPALQKGLRPGKDPPLVGGVSFSALSPTSAALLRRGLLRQEWRGELELRAARAAAERLIIGAIRHETGSTQALVSESRSGNGL